MSEKIWSDDAWEDYLYWQTQDKKNTKAHQPAHPGYRTERLYAGDWETRTPLRRPAGRIQPPHQRKRPARLPYGKRTALHRPLQRPLWR